MLYPTRDRGMDVYLLVVRMVIYLEALSFRGIYPGSGVLKVVPHSLMS